MLLFLFFQPPEWSRGVEALSAAPPQNAGCQGLTEFGALCFAWRALSIRALQGRAPGVVTKIVPAALAQRSTVSRLLRLLDRLG